MRYASMRRPDVTQQEMHWNNSPRYYVHTCVHTTISQDREVPGCSFSRRKRRGAPGSEFLRYYVNERSCVCDTILYVQAVFRIRRGTSFPRMLPSLAEEISPFDECQEISGESHVKDDMLLSSMYTMHRSLTFVRDKETLPIHLRISRPRWSN